MSTERILLTIESASEQGFTFNMLASYDNKLGGRLIVSRKRTLDDAGLSGALGLAVEELQKLTPTMEER